MKKIKVNNDGTLALHNKDNGIEVVALDSNETIDYSYIIPDGDIVMLLNYWINCKHGIEKSDYIAEGKVKNTNTDVEEYI